MATTRVKVVVAVLVAQMAVSVGTPGAVADAGVGVAEGDAARLRGTSDGPVRIVEHEATGFVRFVGAAAGRTLGRPAGVASSDPAEEAAEAFLRSHGRAFGVTQPDRDLVPQVASEMSRGRGHAVRFQQTHHDVPVLAGELVVRTDAENRVLSVAGETLPSIDVNVAPGIPAAEAADVATGAVARHADVDVTGLSATPPELAVLDPTIFGGPGLPGARLVWRTEVASATSPSLRELVLVDADRGTVAVRFSLVHEAKNRTVCDNAGVMQASYPLSGCTDPARVEGGPAVAVADVNAAYDFSGGFYDLLLGHFGRDSLDGLGGTLKSTARWCDDYFGCPMHNAFWSGSEMYYGEGFAVDDVVGHELAHGLTQHTANLFYYYQSGAINESLSDVFGELFDLETGGDDDVGNRWLIGEDLSIGALRDMASPTAFGHPDKIGSGFYVTTADDSGGVHSNSGVNNKAAYLLVDGDSFNGITVAPIGADKTLQVYYEAQSALLTSGADYSDLADALEQACANLVGSHGITLVDCDQVANAVTATEMRLEPPGATTLDAARCASADIVVPRYSEDVEGVGASSDWTTTATHGQAWTTWDGYTTSGSTSFLGENAAVTGTSDLAMTSDVGLPGGSYLRFSHAYEFEANAYDGGVLEYSTDGGGEWSDAGPLIVDNGYTGAIRTGFGNPLAGRSAYVNASGGYTAARVDLTGLAGEDIRFRWRLATDGVAGGLGWFVDDIAVYACDADRPSFGAGAELTASSPTGTSTVLSWAAADDDVGVATYRVLQAGSTVATVDGGTTAHEVAGLVPATAYDFSVVAVDMAGRTSTRALTRTVTTADTVAPAFPPDARLTASRPDGDELVALSWTAATDNVGVDHYEVTTSPATDITSVPAGTATTLLADLRVGPDHRFDVRAVDAAGNASDALSATPAALVPREVIRMAGGDRFDTAARVSADRFPAGADVVYIATGLNFPDALAAGPVAGLQGAPILLVSDDGIPDVTAVELRRLGPERIIVLGGDAVVPPSVEQQLRSLASGDVRRIAGDDRYATAVEVSRTTFDPGVPVVYVATGSNFPDAVAGAAAAGRDDGPIVLVSHDAIPSVVVDELARLTPARIVILGGSGAVSADVERQLGAFTSGGVSRLQGGDRYATAAAIASTFPTETNIVYVATGGNFPDALTGTPPAVVGGAAVLLVPGDRITDTVEAQLERLRPRRIVVLGGEAVIGGVVAEQLQGYLE